MSATSDPSSNASVSVAQTRGATARVAAQARLVRIDDDALRRLASCLDLDAPAPLPEETWDGPAAERAMGIVAWNTINFGSGWFPLLDKIDGLSGARTLATRWRAFFAERRPDATWLVDVTRDEVARVLGQSAHTEVVELLDLFVAAWVELGELLLDRYDGQAINLVEECDRSALALADVLGSLPGWRDVHAHEAGTVPLFKRAQIVTSHLHEALADVTALARFDDLDRLTAFADNLVPHVLRHHRVLLVDDTVIERIEAGDLLVSGEVAEVELRAVAVHAVEELVSRIQLDRPGQPVTAARVDQLLWRAGQDPAIKTRPRHRCRCRWY